MICRLCAWLCDRFCPPELHAGALWDAGDAWEEDFANDWEPDEPGAGVRQRWNEAERLIAEDPAAALAIHLELAAQGSAFSLLKAGWFHECGLGCAKDLPAAEDFYRRAIDAGSWRATLGYARLLFRRGADDLWPRTLGDGVNAGFIPSYFRMAWCRYERSPSATTAREVRSLLEAAARAGHPGAELTLVRWMASGKFGLREIPAGFRRGAALARSAVERENEAARAGAPIGQPAVVDQAAR